MTVLTEAQRAAFEVAYGPEARRRCDRLERDVEVLELLESARHRLDLSFDERRIVARAIADQAAVVEHSLAAFEEFAG